MIQEDINLGNKEIAIFMGYKISYLNGYQLIVELGDAGCLLSIWAKYHLSWEELMPVVEKIINKGSMCLISGFDKAINPIGLPHASFSIEDDLFADVQAESENSVIEACWKAVAEYCTIYNKIIEKE